jgi:hypothetical protein
MFLINAIEVVGNTVLSEKETAHITQPFSGKRLGPNRINLLLRRFTEAFVAKGFVTTRAYVGEQNLKRGTLTITVVPGKVEAIVVNGKPLSSIADTNASKPLPGVVNGGWLTDEGTLLASPVTDPNGRSLRFSTKRQMTQEQWVAPKQGNLDVGSHLLPLGKEHMKRQEKLRG